MRRHRGTSALVGGLVVLVLLSVLLTGARAVGTLDPDGYDPQGSHALAVLLERRGVDVLRTTDVPGTQQVASGPGTAVLVPMPGLLSDEELRLLGTLPGPLVVVEAGPSQLDALGLEDVQAVSAGMPVEPRAPGCSDPVAANAGRARAGGISYATGLPGASLCYGDEEDGAPLLRTGRVILLGSSEVLTNDHLDEDGNAALAIGLLSSVPAVAWLVPSPNRADLGERPVRSPDDLVATWLKAARWWLLLVAGVLALWRGRRLGRVVTEQLPVVVRASETTEGHGRLYRAAGARDRASEELRAARRRDLSRLAHGGGGLGPDVLVDLVAARTGRQPGEVRALLYGPTPADDAALVRLARDLDELAREALTREGAPT